MQPSRARYRVLAFTTILAIITYLDRVAISTAAPAVRAEMGLDAVQMGWVFSAFTWAYAAFEIPSGWMGDVMGPRKVLTRIVIWWSAFTAATGARLEFRVAVGGALPVRRRRSRSVSEYVAKLCEVVSRCRTRRRARLGLHGHAHGGRDHPADRGRPDGRDRMAADVLRVRGPRCHLGVLLVAMVSGRAVATSRSE